MKNRLRLTLAAIGAACMTQVAAQEVTLKVHHFLPAGSSANTMFIQPWCDRIAKDSGNKMKCQIYPSMQLGGTPPQLYDQVQGRRRRRRLDAARLHGGPLPAGRGVRAAVHDEKPEGTSKALWEYVEKYAPNEFGDVKLIAFARPWRRRVPHDEQADQDARGPQGPEGARADAADQQVPRRARCHAGGDAGAAGRRGAGQGRDRRCRGAVGGGAVGEGAGARQVPHRDRPGSRRSTPRRSSLR